MKTEHREVTVTQEVYIADDGKEFTYEDECKDYEYSILRKSFKCLDFDYNEVGIDEAAFVELPTKLIVKNFIECCEFEGIHSDGIAGPGLYIYTEYQGGQWVNMDEAIAIIKGGLTK
jgi:hypothetical protein